MNTYQIMAQTFFKDRTGNPFLLTQGQSEIFRIIYEPSVLRGAILSFTQYGKSDVTSMACIAAGIERREKILIVAPSDKQASIIMGNLIDHLFDDEDITAMLEYDPSSLDRLKRERSKERITLRNGTEFFTLTADVRTISKNALNLMGFGASIVIADEASLIPDIMFNKILRMVGGVDTGKLIKLGNPFERNHFFRSLHSPRYEKIIIDYHQGIREGRITQDFIDEAKQEMIGDFEIMYECKFPAGGADNALIPLDWIELAVNQQGVNGDLKQAGLDVARYGRDKSVYCLRKGGNVIGLTIIDNIDTMGLVGKVTRLMDTDEPEVLAVDVVGIGSGVYDRMEELGYAVHAVNVGESPTDPDAKEKFFNLRAEVHWGLRDLFKPDKGKSMISIPQDPGLITELTELRYKYSSEKKIRIEDKDDMKKRIGRSPDRADALSLAFFDIEGRAPEMFIY